MNIQQKKDFLVTNSFDWKLIETKFFPMTYKRHIYSSKILRRAYHYFWREVNRIFLSLLSYKDLKILKYPSEHSGWFKFLEKDFEKWHNIINFDLIMSSSSPFETHVLANYFSNKLQIPWIADYRDLFSGNYVTSEFQKFIEFEKKLISRNHFRTIKK
jgi:hypothetical protein